MSTYRVSLALTNWTTLARERGSVGQSEGLSIPRSSVRFRLKPYPKNTRSPYISLGGSKFVNISVWCPGTSSRSRGLPSDKCILRPEYRKQEWTEGTTLTMVVDVDFCNRNCLSIKCCPVKMIWCLNSCRLNTSTPQIPTRAEHGRWNGQ